MKAYIGAGVAGALALAGVIAVSTRTSPAVQAAPERASQGASLLQGMDPAQQPILVNCGEGRQAMVRQTLVGERTVSRVECVPDAVMPYGTDAAGMTSSFGVPGQQFQAPVVTPMAPAPAAQERIVYRDRPVYRDRVVQSSAPARTSAPVYASNRSGDDDREVRKPGRSWKKSAAIIGGSAAGGAGLGAILGGKSGAKKGAVVGGVAGTIYDIATRNKDDH